VHFGEPVTVNSVSSETLITPGQKYDAYVRVHNDFGCNPVGGVQARVFLADPEALSTPWAAGEITNGAYTTGTGQPAGGITVAAGQPGLLGPFTFTAPTSGFGNGHRCALADIIATGQGPTTTPFDPVSSSQVAQRNLQIENCGFGLTNSSTDPGNLQLTLSVTTPADHARRLVRKSRRFYDVYGDAGFMTWRGLHNVESGDRLQEPHSGRKRTHDSP
jgi:hypothetical protein